MEININKHNIAVLKTKREALYSHTFTNLLNMKEMNTIIKSTNILVIAILIGLILFCNPVFSQKHGSADTTSVGLLEHSHIVKELEDLLNKDSEMEKALLASLNVAVKSAKNNLNKDLYKVTDRVFQGNGWPITINAYLNYLELYARLIPNEKNDPQYPDGWKSNGKQNGYNQKVYDLLCQFYWLVNQELPASSQTMQSFEEFASWLDKFAKTWGTFLDTKASLTKETLNSFKYDPMYNFPLYADSQKSWDTFNQFFYREFNQSAEGTGITPLRPIAEPTNNQTIVAPADCTFKKDYLIDDFGNVLDENGNETTITFKKTHTIGTIADILGGSSYAKDFYGGTFVHYFLSPFDYHRFHTSVGGKVVKIEAVQSKVYLDVNITDDGQWDAPDGGENGYEFTQSRGIIILDAGPVVGKIAIIPIGMAQVSGVDMYTKLEGKTVQKGQEFGKFRFGGSDIILLFENTPNLYLFKKDPSHKPIHFQYGQTVSYWNYTSED
tara:strand:+ start:2094 stop:3581 length:1488 start_codon:yes stop_codon:yes gene_type:complete